MAHVFKFPSGRTIQGWIIPAFYPRKEDVPFPAKIYGSFDCFLDSCLRRGDLGFLTEQQMRIHADRSHPLEYKAHLEAAAASRVADVDSLRRRIEELTSAQLQAQAPIARAAAQVPAQSEVSRAVPRLKARKRKAKARAAKRSKAAGSVA